MWCVKCQRSELPEGNKATEHVSGSRRGGRNGKKKRRKKKGKKTTKMNKKTEEKKKKMGKISMPSEGSLVSPSVMIRARFFP